MEKYKSYSLILAVISFFILAALSFDFGGIGLFISIAGGIGLLFLIVSNYPEIWIEPFDSENKNKND